MESGGIVPCILNTSALGRGRLHCPAVLPLGPSLWYPLCRRFGGSQSHSGNGEKLEHSLPLPGVGPRSSSPSILYWLSYPGW